MPKQNFKLVISIIIILALIYGVQNKKQTQPMILGDYSAELRIGSDRMWADVPMDVDLTIERLEQANVNTYFYLFGHAPSHDYNDFYIFLNKTNMDVYGYLPSPSTAYPDTAGCMRAPPHYCNYNGWAEEFATLSLQYPNFKGWVIDDFYRVHEVKGEQAIIDFIQISKNINPNFKFYPIDYYSRFSNFKLYYGDYTSKSYYDGIIFPFISRWPVCNHNSTVELDPQITIFHHLYNNDQANIGRVIHPGDVESTQGDYVAFTAPLSSLDSTVEYWIMYTLWPATLPGYHFVQILIDDTVVWESDIVDLPNRYEPETFIPDTMDISSYPETSEMTFRFYEKQKVWTYRAEVQFILPNGDWQMSTLGDTQGWLLPTLDLNWDLITMIYNWPHSNCGDANPEAIRDATNIAIQRAKQGDAIGVTQYVMPKDNVSNPQYSLIAELYGETSATTTTTTTTTSTTLDETPTQTTQSDDSFLIIAGIFGAILIMGVLLKK